MPRSLDTNIKLSLDDFTQNFRTVVFGKAPDRPSITVSANLLSKHSLFFQAAFDKPWQFSQSKDAIEMESGQHDAFMVFMAWVMSGSIWNTEKLQQISPGRGHRDKATILNTRRIQWNQLIDCYILSDFLQAPRFGNDIMDALIKALKYYAEAGNRDGSKGREIIGCALDTIHRVWSQTTIDSPLRQLLIDAFLAGYMQGPENEDLAEFESLGLTNVEAKLEQEFMAQLLPKMRGHMRHLRFPDPPWNLTENRGNMCKYHIRTDRDKDPCSSILPLPVPAVQSAQHYYDDYSMWEVD